MIPFHFRDPASVTTERESAIPAGLKTKAELFRVLKATLSLPAYFGNNWDALEECLHDLDWPAGQERFLIHADVPPIDAPADQSIYLKILAGAARAFPRLQIVFPERDRALVERLLSDPPPRK
jgi:hypothetical protein